MEHDIVKLRSNERILALSIAGLSIVLGFLLFIFAPDAANTGSGNLEFLKMKLTLANVAPGIFFACFGAGVTIYSIVTQVKVSEVSKGKDQVVVNKQLRYLQDAGQDNKEIENLRGAYQKDFRTLAKVTDKIDNNEPIPDSLKLDMTNSMTNTKDALMRSVWAEEWGDYSIFKAWLAKGYPEPAPVEIKKAAEFFLGK